MGLFGNKGFNENQISFRCEKVNAQALPKGLSIKQGDFFNAYPTSDSGQFGSLATFKRGNKLYAIKYLDKNWTPTKADEIQDQCLKEYEQLCKINGLNNCPVASAPKAYAFGEVCTNKNSNRYPAIVMDYIEDPSLFEAVERGLISENPVKRINTKTTIQIAINIAEGYNSLHKAGIIHRDGSQNNIRISLEDEHHITFLDFGNSINLGTARRTFTRGATPYFGAPEVFNKNANRNHASQDLWTLGALIYYIRYGKKPHETLIEESNGMPSDYLEIKENHPLDLIEALGSSDLQKGDKELAAFILSCTQFNIQDRISRFKNADSAFSFSCVIEQLKEIRVAALGDNKPIKKEKPQPYKLPLQHSMALKIIGKDKNFSRRLDFCTRLANELGLLIDATFAKDDKYKTILIRLKETEQSRYSFSFSHKDYDILETVMEEYLKCDKDTASSLTLDFDMFVFKNESSLIEVEKQYNQIKEDLANLNLKTDFIKAPRIKSQYALVGQSATSNTTVHDFHLTINASWAAEDRIEQFKSHLKIHHLTAKYLSRFDKFMFDSRYAMSSFLNRFASSPLFKYFNEMLPEKRLIILGPGEDPRAAAYVIRSCGDNVCYSEKKDCTLSDLNTIEYPILIWCTNPDGAIALFKLLSPNSTASPFLIEEASEVFYLKGLPSSQIDTLSLNERRDLLLTVANKPSRKYTINDYRLITSLLSQASRLKLKELIENKHLSIPDAYRQIISSPRPWENSVYETIRFKEQPKEKDTIHSYETEKFSNNGMHSNWDTQDKCQKDELESILEKDYSDFTESDWQFVLNQMNESTIALVMRLTDNRGWKVSSSCIFVLERTLHPWKNPQRLNPKYKSVEQLPL